MPKHYRRAASPRSSFLGLDEAGTEFWLSGPHITSCSGRNGDSPGCFVSRLAHFNRCRRNNPGERRRRRDRRYAADRKEVR